MTLVYDIYQILLLMNVFTFMIWWNVGTKIKALSIYITSISWDREANKKDGDEWNDNQS